MRLHSFLFCCLLIALAAHTTVLSAPAPDGIIRRNGWDYDRAEFLDTIEEIAAAKKSPKSFPLTGWIEFDVNIPASGWHELYLGGTPPGWARDLFVDGASIYRLSGSEPEDALSKATREGIQFKDINLYLPAGTHTLRFRRMRGSAALPAVWELRPAMADDPAASITTRVNGSRILKTGATCAIDITAGTTRATRYHFSLENLSTGERTALPAMDVPALPSPNTGPVTTTLHLSFSGPGLYTLQATAKGTDLKPADLKAGLFLVSDNPEFFATGPKRIKAQEKLEVASLFRNGAILQCDKPLPVWGWANPSERIVITLGEQTETTTAVAPDGRWQVTFKPLPAGKTIDLRVSASTGENVTIQGLLTGEVWLLSGQSNMGGPILSSIGGEAAACAANSSLVRLAYTATAAIGPDDAYRLAPAKWMPAISSGNARQLKGWNAIPLAFGIDLQTALNVPVGLINNNRGGTTISTWTSRAAHLQDTTLQPLLEDYELSLRERMPESALLEKAAREVAKWRTAGATGPDPLLKLRADPPRNAPGLLYDQLIAPIAPFAIRGVLWYQGESDNRQAEAYRVRLPAMIRDWRKAWGDESIEFIIAQIATGTGKPYEGAPGDSSQAELREAQAWALSLPHTAMIATMDLPRPTDDVHYLDKLPVGKRFALAALANVYGKNILWSGPVYQTMRVEGGTIRLHFDHVAAGLRIKPGDAAPGGFAIAGKDRKWVWANARIDGNTVVVSSPKVSDPVAVRYGWTGTPCGANLQNSAGLPTPCFRTDDWPLATAGRLGGIFN